MRIQSVPAVLPLWFPALVAPCSCGGAHDVSDGEKFRCPTDPSTLDGGMVVVAGPATDAMLKTCFGRWWRTITAGKRSEGKRLLKCRERKAEYQAKMRAALVA